MKQKKWVRRAPSKTKELKEPKPTPRDKAFLDKVIADPLVNKTHAYLETHETTNRNTARANAAHLMRKESSRIYLKKHEKEAKRVVVEVMQIARANSDKVAWQRLALDSANSLLDRQIGKPLQSVRSESSNLNINVEASQELSDQFTAFIKNQTLQ